MYLIISMFSIYANNLVIKFLRICGDVLVLHTPIIKCIFEISITCIAVGKNGKENMEGLKTVQLGTISYSVV